METGKIIHLEQLKTLFDNIPEAVYVVEIDTYKILYLNKFILDLLHINENNYIGKYCYEVLQGEHSLCKFCANNNLQNKTIIWSYKSRLNGRTYRCIDKKIYVGNESIPAKLELAIDITNEVGYQDELIKNKKLLKKELEEKEILIKEIHHRVKNNTQLLVSLLHLQSMKTRSKTIKATLFKIIERIKAISTTYNSLYLRKDLHNINLSKHIEEIITNVSLSVLNPYNIITEINIDESIIVNNINKVTPLGIIINELLSNCAKHAFSIMSDEDEKKVKISLTKNGNEIILTVEDNGMGLPHNYNIKKQSTMGSLLVNTLASQLGAKVKYNSENGTRVVLNFKIE